MLAVDLLVLQDISAGHAILPEHPDSEAYRVNIGRV